jgi:hypothetical protein
MKRQYFFPVYSHARKTRVTYSKMYLVNDLYAYNSNLAEELSVTNIKIYCRIMEFILYEFQTKKKED